MAALLSLFAESVYMPNVCASFANMTVGGGREAAMLTNVLKWCNNGLHMASHNFVDENEYADRLIPRESAPELKADVRAAAEYPLREGQPNQGVSENLSGFQTRLEQ
ncbi:MAG: hypothetical protein J7639_04370 [Paenibacillaceae bacterium]|nr:hypothetical protein [Paenibacillaceae bacterium]